MKHRNYRNIFFISLSQFGLAFSFNFVLVFLPFYVHKISPYSPRESLVWVGLIMGAPSAAAAVFATFWGSLTSRCSPKVLFMRGLLSHAVLIAVMGFVTNLPLLLALRIVQGMLGGISTVGFVIVSASSTEEHAAKDIGLYQNAMTLGQLAGPPLGAMAAAALGYAGAFLSASAFIFLTLVVCLIYVAEVPREHKGEQGFRKSTLNPKTLAVWGLCFTATIQLMFLPSILPNVFHGFGLGREAALKWAGIVVMSYTATAMAGTYLLCRLAARFSAVRLIIPVTAAGILLQVLLSVAPGMTGFLVVRLLHAAVIASVLPLAFSVFATDLDGRVIGFLNSGRFAGNALGPIIATTVLAATNLTSLYLAIGGLSLAALLSFVSIFGARRERIESGSESTTGRDGPARGRGAAEPPGEVSAD